MKFFTLSNGAKMPAIGSGTNNFGRSDSNSYDSELNGDFSAMDTALEVGYRMFDTALIYGNEDGIGERIKNSGVPREEFFIMGKIPNQAPYNDNEESIRAAVEGSLKNLQMDYFDMFLIHKAIPTAEERAGVKVMKLDKTLALWHVLEKLHKEGKLHGIGVSNFTVEQLEQFLPDCNIIPMVNEVRCNPAMRNTEVVEYCKAHGIQPIAHSPLSFSVAAGVFAVDEDYKAKLASVGEKYGKHWAQVQLRYNYQNGIASIPRSSKKRNQASNLDIFDFRLTDEEMLLLSK